jgi:hypothetical protein
MRANLKVNRYSQYKTGVRLLTTEAALGICVSASNAAYPRLALPRRPLDALNRLVIEIVPIEAAISNINHILT